MTQTDELVGDERAALLAFLGRQRELVVWKLADADHGALRAPSTPSGMTLPGLVRHLENVERSWIRDVFAGQQGLSFDWTDADPDGEWKVPAEIGAARLLLAYQEETRRCDEVIAAAALDERSADGRFTLRWILLHLIEETARHLGHIDLLRENADGQVGEEPR